MLFASSHRRFHAVCISPPFEIHTRVRQEKGQDIAGACGQLALVNPGKGGGDSAGASGDIEDFMGNAAKKGKVKPPVRDASGSGSGSKSKMGKVNGVPVHEHVGKDLTWSKMLCYVNIVLPIALASLGLFVRA